jgi:uncharacterized protein (DUF736 family)
MAVIGTFTPTKDGGWSGTVRTLTLDIKARFVPNDNKDSDRSPAFRIYSGQSEIGAAWRERSAGDLPRDYLSVRLDDPSLPQPIAAALFTTGDGEEAQLVWNRR